MDRLIKVLVAGVFIVLTTKVQAQTDKPKAVAHLRKASSPVETNTRSFTSITIAPNPVVDDFEVHTNLDDWMGGTITLKDRFGRIIERVKITEATSSFSLKNGKKGVYTIAVRNGAKERVLKVIKM